MESIAQMVILFFLFFCFMTVAGTPYICTLQYAYFKQMTRAAMVIQNGFRSYCEHKRFKKSQEAAVCIQNYYRNYREQGGRGGSREGTPSNAVQANSNCTGSTSSSSLK
jgi:hypothetical protein